MMTYDTMPHDMILNDINTYVEKQSHGNDNEFSTIEVIEDTESNFPTLQRIE